MGKREVSQFLSVSVRTVERMMREGLLNPVRIRARVLFRREDIEALAGDGGQG